MRIKLSVSVVHAGEIGWANKFAVRSNAWNIPFWKLLHKIFENNINLVEKIWL
jgi:hypothetical protein